VPNVPTNTALKGVKPLLAQAPVQPIDRTEIVDCGGGFTATVAAQKGATLPYAILGTGCSYFSGRPDWSSRLVLSFLEQLVSNKTNTDFLMRTKALENGAKYVLDNLVEKVGG
jgi:hypothetical protein